MDKNQVIVCERELIFQERQRICGDVGPSSGQAYY